MSELDVLGYRNTKVVITGCASGMGEATARILGELGAELHTVDITKPSVPHVAYYETDLSDPDQVSVTARALHDVGPFDFLFNCAGIPHVAGPMRCMLVNYIGTRQLTDELLDAIADGGGIAIIASDAGMGWERNLASHLELLAISDPVAAREWCEQRPELIGPGYSVSKEMLIVWAQHRAISLGQERGIRMNCIAPCPTSTAFMEQTVPAVGQDFFDRYPYPLLGRMATAEEQAWPLILLNSPRNAVTTGAVLYTDQGFTGGVLTGALDASGVMGLPED